MTVKPTNWVIFQFVQHFWIARGEQKKFRNYKLETERTCQIQTYLINNVLTKNWNEKFCKVKEKLWLFINNTNCSYIKKRHLWTVIVTHLFHCALWTIIKNFIWKFRHLWLPKSNILRLFLHQSPVKKLYKTFSWLFEQI